MRPIEATMLLRNYLGHMCLDSVVTLGKEIDRKSPLILLAG
jgi:hypothetical protein